MPLVLSSAFKLLQRNPYLSFILQREEMGILGKEREAGAEKSPVLTSDWAQRHPGLGAKDNLGSQGQTHL